MSSKESEVIIVNATTEKKCSTDNNNVKKKASRNQLRYSCRDSMEDQLESESLLINSKKQSPCSIPMSPVSSSSYINSPLESSDVSSSQKLLRNTSSNTISVKDSPELQSIQPANSRLNLPIKLSASKSTTSISSKSPICSPQFCCGRNPKKITFIVFAIVLLWSIVIFCLNMQKQLSLHKEKMEILQEEILKLELRNADLKQENGKINVFLQKIATSLLTSKTNKKLYSQGSTAKPKKKETPKNEICTANGQKCIFPFIYKNVVHRSCVKEWSYPRPWCATKVDHDGMYISGDSSSWSDCLESC